MCIFVCFVTIYLLYMVSLYKQNNWIAAAVSIVSIFTNLILFIKTMFGDPGISPQIYMHYIKMEFSPKYDIGLEDEEPNDDLENGSSNSVTQRGAKKISAKQPDMMAQYKKEVIDNLNYLPKYWMKDEKTKILFCEKCNCEVTAKMEHCIDCQVCVNKIDHHCIFFSKCIGGGNACSFYASIGLLIFNFALIGVSAMFWADWDEFNF